MACTAWCWHNSRRIRAPAISFSSATACTPGSRFSALTGVVYGFAQTDPSYTARLTRAAKLFYPYHPLFRNGPEVLEVIGLRSDMIVVRLQDGSRRGIPAWMFDEVECARVRDSPRPVVEAKSLLRIVDLLERNGWGNRTGGDESQPPTLVGDTLARADTGTASIRPSGSPQPNPGRKAGRVPRSTAHADRNGRRSPNSRSGRGR